MTKKVVLDAGHGLPDPGAVKFGQEYKYALDIVKEIANRLPSEIKPILTRTTDRALNDSKGIDLKKRCDISNNANADLFVSIHLNAGGGTGYETLVYAPNNQGVILHNEMKQVLSAYGVADRGIKSRPDLAVLKGTRATALMLELAFIDNKADMDLINNQTYYNALCQAIADGISKALGVDPKTVTSAGQAVSSEGEKTVEKEPFTPSVQALRDSVNIVLTRFEQKDPALSKQWREAFNAGKLSESDAIGILFHAVRYGWITGKME